MYLVAKAWIVGTEGAELCEWDEMDVADVLRVNGEVRAVDRRKGFEEDDEEDGPGKAEGVMLVVWIGGSDGGPTDVGRPPGVRDRFRDMPMPPSESIDWECGREERGVPDLGRSGMSDVGVLERGIE